MSEEDPQTGELRIQQMRREVQEREQAERGDDDDPTTDQHEARATKARYLRKKLEDRADAEREAGAGRADREADTARTDEPG